MTPTDKTGKKKVSLARMLACIEFLLEYFGQATVVKLQYTERFGCNLSLEAGGLTFDMFQPKRGDLDLMVYSAEGTEIKLACASLPLDDNGQIGIEALSAIKLRQEAITPKGRENLLRLNRSSFGKLYQDLHTSRRQRRGQLLTERCMRHIQTPQSEPHRNLQDHTAPESRHMRPISEMLRLLEENDVTVLRPEYFKNFLAAFDHGAPYTGIRDVSPDRQKPLSLARYSQRIRPLVSVSPEFDTCSVTKTLGRLMRVLPEENKPRDYRDETPTNQ